MRRTPRVRQRRPPPRFVWPLVADAGIWLDLTPFETRNAILAGLLPLAHVGGRPRVRIERQPGARVEPIPPETKEGLGLPSQAFRVISVPESAHLSDVYPNRNGPEAEGSPCA